MIYENSFSILIFPGIYDLRFSAILCRYYSPLYAQYLKQMTLLYSIAINDYLLVMEL